MKIRPVCPKCGHQRTKNDDIYPDYECPKCKVIYAKANQKRQLPDKPNDSIFNKWKTSYHNWIKKQECSYQKQPSIKSMKQRTEEQLAKDRKIIGLCPRCKSNRTVKTDASSYRVLGVVSIIAGCLLVLIPPLFIIGVGGGIGFLMISSFVKTTYGCQDCKLSWKPGENPFPEIN